MFQKNNEDKKVVIYVQSYVISHTNREMFDIPVEIIFKHKINNKTYHYMLRVENDSKLYIVDLLGDIIEMNVYSCIDYQKSDVYCLGQ